jgi:MerR family transcriptional regulator, copper efflux regulator
VGTYRISELAARVGVPATTLRFYEREGLLPAARTSSGYRQYTDGDRDRLAFIAAAKDLGLPLRQIRELLEVWAGGMCRDVRDGLRPRVSGQIAAAEDRIADLHLFRDRLVAALAHLRELPARDGPCDPTCSFLSDCPDTRPESRTGVPVACSLDAGAYRDRIDEWDNLLDGAEVTVLRDGGRSARIPAERAGDATRLAVAEQRCCPFLSFGLEFAGDRVVLTARAPEQARELVDALFDRARARPC